MPSDTNIGTCECCGCGAGCNCDRCPTSIVVVVAGIPAECGFSCLNGTHTLTKDPEAAGCEYFWDGEECTACGSGHNLSASDGSCLARQSYSVRGCVGSFSFQFDYQVPAGTDPNKEICCIPDGSYIGDNGGSGGDPCAEGSTAEVSS